MFPVLIADNSFEDMKSKDPFALLYLAAALHQICISIQELQGHLKDTRVQETVRLSEVPRVQSELKLLLVLTV